MARHEDIVNTIWDDLDHLSNDAFLLYVWSWTNTKCGMAGLYPVTRRTILEGRLEQDRLDAALAELEADDKLYYVDGVLWNKARVSRLAGFKKGRLSAVLVRAIEKDLRSIHRDHPLLDRFLDRYGDHPGLEGLKTVYRPSREGQDSALVSGDADGLETVQGQGQGQGRGQFDSYQGSVLATLERVAYARGLSSPVVDATDRANVQFAHIDLDSEAENFAHYWIDGPGATRPLTDVSWAWRQWLGRVKSPQSVPPAGSANAARSSVSADLHRLQREAEEARAAEGAAL